MFDNIQNLAFKLTFTALDEKNTRAKYKASSLFLHILISNSQNYVFT